jgi:hypothetical protein
MIFFDKASSFDLSILFFFLNIYRRSPNHKPSKETPKSKSKMDTKNHEKSIFNLTMCQFLFSKYITVKGLYILKNVCWVFDQKAWFFKKIFFKQRHLWFHFNKLDLNRHDLWNVRVDSRRKIVRQRRTSIESTKSLTEITSTLLNTPWKVEPLGGNTVDPEKEKQAIVRSAGG